MINERQLGQCVRIKLYTGTAAFEWAQRFSNETSENTKKKNLSKSRNRAIVSEHPDQIETNAK